MHAVQAFHEGGLLTSVPVAIIPDFGGHEQFGARHTALRDALTDFGFVVVDVGRVDRPVAGFDGGQDRRDGLGGLELPSAKAQLWRTVAIMEGEVGLVGGHGAPRGHRYSGVDRMSVHSRTQRVTVPQLMACKGSQKIAALTAYSAPIARLLDDALDMVLVGDSTAMVAYALPDTLSISVPTMTAHAAAVVRVTHHACVVVDMPFGSYQQSPSQAFANAAAMLAGSGVSGVKLEGGAALAETTRFLVDRGIPVLAHVGLMPQYMNVMGGFKAQGMTPAAADRIFEDARAHADAGAF